MNEKPIFMPSQIILDASGKCILDDQLLAAVEDGMAEWVAGGYATTNDGCKNETNCEGTTNTNSCTNSGRCFS
jgi:hypothetical protein